MVDITEAAEDLRQQQINEIASQHLGKAGDGSVVKPYVTPDEVDSSLSPLNQRKTENKKDIKASMMG